MHDHASQVTRDAADEALKRYFGFDGFRGRQRGVVDLALAGRDSIALFPTGAGKSICYQIPSIVRPGTGLVISPLIALMQDQVRSLRSAGVAVGALHSEMTPAERKSVHGDLLAGRLHLLYVSPERALTDGFMDLLRRIEVALVAIDEAHCVSQWGHDFRPEYVRLSELRPLTGAAPWMALTATADEATRRDIVRQLRLETAEILTTSFDRSNIRYSIVERDEPKRQIRSFLKSHAGETGIVYHLSRKKVEETARFLQESRFNALPYHAGMTKAERTKAFDAFQKDEDIILVATIAFGMGIDKPNVRFVCHLDLPGSVEAYYQETGRAGRDGEPAEAWMAYGMQDVVLRRRMIDESTAPDAIKRIERSKLSALLGITEAAGCRRAALLSHFGERLSSGCGNCDTCLSPTQTWDGTEAARKMMSAILRSRERFGVGHIVDILRGKSTDKVTRFGHHKLPTFGVGKDIDDHRWKSVARQLVAAGHLGVNHDAHGALRLEETARPILKGEESILFRDDRSGRQAAVIKGLKSSVARQTTPTLDEGDQALLRALQAERKAMAEEANVPPYIIFPNAVLDAMVCRSPRSLLEMMSIPGVGATKLTKYGPRMLRVMEEHMRRQGDADAA